MGSLNAEATRSAERARVVDVRRGELELLGQVGHEADHAAEEVLDVARERLELLRLLEHVSHLLDDGDEVRLVGDGLRDPDPVETLDEDAQRPVWDADEFVHRRRSAHRVEVVEAGLLDLGVAGGDQRDGLVLAGDDVVDQPDRALLADGKRRDGVGKDDRVLERQDAELLPLRHSARTSIEMLTALCGFCASGTAIVSRPFA